MWYQLRQSIKCELFSNIISLKNIYFFYTFNVGSYVLTCHYCAYLRDYHKATFALLHYVKISAVNLTGFKIIFSLPIFRFIRTHPKRQTIGTT